MAFTYTVDNNEITITGYTGSSAGIVIPNQIDGIPVKKIGNEAFKNKKI